MFEKKFLRIPKPEELIIKNEGTEKKYAIIGKFNQFFLFIFLIEDLMNEE